MIGYISFAADILIAIAIVIGVFVLIFGFVKVLAYMKTKKRKREIVESWNKSTFYD